MSKDWTSERSSADHFDCSYISSMTLFDKVWKWIKERLPRKKQKKEKKPKEGNENEKGGGSGGMQRANTPYPKREGKEASSQVSKRKATSTFAYIICFFSLILLIVVIKKRMRSTSFFFSFFIWTSSLHSLNEPFHMLFLSCSSDLNRMILWIAGWGRGIDEESRKEQRRKSVTWRERSRDVRRS